MHPARSLVAALLGAAVSIPLAPSEARAAPVAHILRIDPRAALRAGKPTLTTVIEVVQFQPLSDVLLPCADARGAGLLDCWSAQLEKPHALWLPFPFPEAKAQLLVDVAGTEMPASFVDKAQWGASQHEPDVGTAWLLAVDASSGMGPRFQDAREIAHELIAEMRPHDLVDLVLFDDVQTVRDTRWVTYEKRATLADVLNQVRSPMPSHGADRALFRQIEVMTRDAFESLGNFGSPDQVPLHQAMVVLSNGAGRGDPESAAPSADVFHQYLDGGRFPQDNVALPKTPLPVVSIWLPNPPSAAENLYEDNEAQFMQALANPEIGGFFDVVRQGQGAAKARAIVARVRERFDAMWVVHWELACINPSVEQTFELAFENTRPQIAGDATFKDVPIGIDPRQWPLDIDVKKTLELASQQPVYPGGRVTVFGNFCWSGDKSRAEAYFVPAGSSPIAGSGNASPEVATKAMQQLESEHMVGHAVRAADGYVVFEVPDNGGVVQGSGTSAVARLIVYDNGAHRASSLDEKTILTLPARAKPIAWPLVGGVAGFSAVIALLALVAVRSGGKRKRGA